jgi:hypothetical protein
MAAEKQEGALKPVTPARVAEELRKLSSQRKDGTLAADEYEHRFARMIGELRDRRIDGSRAEILANERRGRLRCRLASAHTATGARLVLPLQ